MYRIVVLATNTSDIQFPSGLLRFLQGPRRIVRSIFFNVRKQNHNVITQEESGIEEKKNIHRITLHEK